MSADNWAECPRCVANHDVGYKRNEFREDYEIYGAETGTVTVTYHGECQRCSLLLEFTTEHPIPGYVPPVVQHDLTWGQVPAGWEVLAPDGKWYRITDTSRVGGRQFVGLEGFGHWNRDPAATVTARGVDPSGALEALGWPAVLGDGS